MRTSRDIIEEAANDMRVVAEGLRSGSQDVAHWVRYLKDLADSLEDQVKEITGGE